MIEIKQHDTSRPFTDTLLLGGNPIDLTSAEVALLFHNRRTLLTTRREAAIEDELTGAVSYQPVEEDVATPDTFDVEWEITFQDTTQLTVPSSGYIVLKVNPDLG